jgi:hypothetical protein
MKTIRCEWRFGERSFCEETATHLVSRIDAIRDHWYTCQPHAEQMVKHVASEASPVRRPDRALSPEQVVAFWPPRHRAANRSAVIA